MADFRNKLLRFFAGRYAQTDALYKAQMIVSLVSLFVGSVMSLIGTGTALIGLRIVGWVLYLCAVGLLVWSICRFLSRNVAARQRENATWLKLRNRLNPFHRRVNRPADTDTHVFRACPDCRAVLRLPRKMGKHTVRCPRCGKSFTVNIKQRIR